MTPCPKCHFALQAPRPVCPSCGVIFAKLHAESTRPESRQRDDLPRYGPWALGILAALIGGLEFRSMLPITENWSAFEKILFPLSLTDLAFHEAGHVIFGVFGWDFLRIAGGTLMQLLLPLVCLLHFHKQSQVAGISFCIFWIGLNLTQIAFYCADAKFQVLILTTGLSGSEGGGHDWNYLLGVFHLVDESVGVGRLFYMSGLAMMAFSVGQGLQAGWSLLKGPRERNVI